MIKRDWFRYGHFGRLTRQTFGLFSTEMVEVMWADINIVEPGPLVPVCPKCATANAREPQYFRYHLYPKVIKRSEEVLRNDRAKKVNILSQEMEDIKETLNLIVRKVANFHPMISPKLVLYYKYLEQIEWGGSHHQHLARIGNQL